jgi:hypothetical protein
MRRELKDLILSLVSLPSYSEESHEERIERYVALRILLSASTI